MILWCRNIISQYYEATRSGGLWVNAGNITVDDDILNFRCWPLISRCGLPHFWAMSFVGLSKSANDDTYRIPGGATGWNIKCRLVVPWVKAIWAKDGECGTPWPIGPNNNLFGKKKTPVVWHLIIAILTTGSWNLDFVQFVADVHFIVPYTDLIPGCYFHTGCDELTVATDQQRHEDQEYSSPSDHCQCNDQGICLYLFLCSFLQWSRTRPWWRLNEVSITWSRQRKSRLLDPWIVQNTSIFTFQNKFHTRERSICLFLHVRRVITRFKNVWGSTLFCPLSKNIVLGTF